MRVVVVGGAGYIGGHTAKALQQRGYDVLIYDSLATGHRSMCRNLPIFIGDIRDHKKLREALKDCDVIIHFAARAYVGESVRDPRGYFETNVEGSLSLLNTALELGIEKIVFSSSCATYGVPSCMPIPDSAVQNPINPYGDSKLFIERALFAYSRAYGVRSVILRYFNAAGADEQGEIGEAHDPETHLIPSAFEAIEGKRSELEVFGDDYPTFDGTCIRDYIHVCDLAEAHALALEYLANGGSTTAINLGTGTGNSVREVIRMVEEVTGSRVPIKVAARRLGDPPVLVADPAKAKEILGWSAKRDLHKMVSTAWKWHQQIGRKSSLAETKEVASRGVGVID
jgi:UDP-glucose-4-epimerase GalE